MTRRALLSSEEPSALRVPLKTAETAERIHGTTEPHECVESNALASVPAGDEVEHSVHPRVPLFTVEEAASLAERSSRTIRKMIESGNLVASTVTADFGRRKGKTEYRVFHKDLFSLYPHAREAWETRQAEARKVHEAKVVKAPQPLYKRDPQLVHMRADREVQSKATRIMNARLAFLEATIRPGLRLLSEYERFKIRNTVPKAILEAALRWLLETEDGQAIAARLGKIPSSETLARWWKALCTDPSGMALQPKSFAAGRERITDKIPGLLDQMRGYYRVTKSYRGVSQELKKRGIHVSENTVRRELAQDSEVLEEAGKKGIRKALTDHGPYVRRAPSRPFQCWSIDGHQLDTPVMWDEPLPGEEIVTFRPYVYAVRDVGSGALLACVMGKGLNRYLPLLVLAEAILRFGVIPETIQPDNGSEVVNRLFDGDEDLIGYWDQLGMDWKDGTALVHNALPYNSRSKPVERDFRTFTESFAARFPAYVGSSTSTRPGAPLAEAMAARDLETVASMKAKLNAWLQERINLVRTVQRRRIKPILALDQEKDLLIRELGYHHPRFVRPEDSWKVLPGLKAKVVREMVTCRIEGNELRFATPLVVGTKLDNLTVRINPWDVREAWLCRGGQKLDALEFVPDGPALGASQTDVVSLRIAKNLERQLKGINKKAEAHAQEIQREAGMRGIRLSPQLVKAIEPKAKPEVIDPAELAEQRQAFEKEARKAKARVEDNVDRYRRLLLFTDPAALTEQDRAWIAEFETTSEGKSLRDAMKDFRRDGAAK